MKTNASFLNTQLTNLRTVSVLAALLLYAAAPGRAACVYDNTFATDGIGANDTVYAAAVQSNGKLVLGGSFTHINGAPRPRFAILNSNGTLDPYFYNNPNNTIRAIVIQPDGKILIGGDFTTVYGGSKPYLARILAAYGTTDSLTVSNLNSSVYAIALQPDGKILIGGSFSSPKPGIARLNSDGTVDTTFTPPVAGTDVGTVYAIAVNTIVSSPNYGKIYIGGNFYKYGTVDRPRIARLNSNGTLDTTFSPPSPNHNVYALAVQWDGEEKILIGGAWIGDSFITSSHFARLYASGSVDHAFDFTFNHVDGDVRTIAIQSDGKILIGGAFTQVNSVSRRGVARLYANGGLDDWSDCGGANNPGTVWTIALQPNGYMYTGGIIIGGYFTHFEFSNQHWMYARLLF